MEEFYTVEQCEEAISIIHNIQDCIKFVFSCHSHTMNSPEAVELTEELREAYTDIREACLELVNSFDYYNVVHYAPFPEDSEALMKELKIRTASFTTFRDAHFDKVLKYNID